jgi:hypothetical protein
MTVAEDTQKVDVVVRVNVPTEQPVLRFLSSVVSGFVEHFRDIKEATDVGLSWQPYHNSFT